jgi:mannose-6-phosphate isomerase class I
MLWAEPASWIIVGFKDDSSAAEYVNHLNDKLDSILNEVVVEEWRCFLLETGNAIGAGLLTEIQQLLDITYRLYDLIERMRMETNENYILT